MSLKRFISKWMMRIRQASAQLKIAFWGITALSTMVTALRGTRFAQYTFYISVFFLASSAIFTYFYDKLQIMNHQNRFRADRSGNFLSPESAINNIIRAKQFTVLAESVKKDWDKEETWTAMESATENALKEYSNGIDIGDYR